MPTDPAPGSRRVSNVIVVFTVVIGGLILVLADWSVVLSQVVHIDLRWMALAAAAALISIWCRSRRFQLLFSGHEAKVGSGIKFYRFSLVHQAVFALMPSGSGDLVFPLLARKYFSQELPSAVAALLVARVQDLTALAVIAGTLAAQSLPGVGYRIAMSAALLVLLFVVVGHSGHVAARVTQRLLSALRAFSEFGRNSETLEAERTEDWEGALAKSRLHGRAFFAWTVLGWLCAIGAVTCVLLASGISVSLGQGALVLVALNLAGAASFFTFAGLGVVEAGLVGVLLWLGMGQESAVHNALTIRVFLLLLNVLLPLAVSLLIGLSLTLARDAKQIS